MPAVRVPAGIADIVVAVAAHVVEVVAAQALRDSEDRRVVYQAGKAGVLVNERDDARTRCAVVRLPGMSAATARPDLLENRLNLFDPVRQQTGEAKIAERFEERDLGIAQPT